MEPTSDTLVCTLTRDLDEKKQREALLFCYSGSKLDANSIGWLPKGAYDNRHDRGEILTLHRNDDLVGFVLMSRPSPYGELRCLQIWVRRDARMILHGRALINKLEEIGRLRHCSCLRLWCAQDLAANLFWATLGFSRRGWRWGPAKVPRRHNLWWRAISPFPLSPSPDGQLETVSLALPKHYPPHPLCLTADRAADKLN